MKRLITLTIFISLFVASSIAQVVIYNNAYPADPTNPDVGLATSIGSAVACSPAGDESVLQTVSLGMTILGFGHQVAFSNSIADDFTLTAGHDIETMRFYAYQTSAGNPSTLDDIKVRIWDGPPGGGGSVIHGDLTTNVSVGSDFSGVYRVTESSMGMSCDRAIQYIDAAVPVSLAAGTYWVEWTVGGSASFSGPWAPPITVVGSTTSGDGLQSLDGGVTFNPAIDIGGQGFPFLITAAADVVPTLGEWAIICLGMIMLIVGVVAVGQKEVQTVRA